MLYFNQIFLLLWSFCPLFLSHQLLTQCNTRFLECFSAHKDSNKEKNRNSSVVPCEYLICFTRAHSQMSWGFGETRSCRTCIATAFRSVRRAGWSVFILKVNGVVACRWVTQQQYGCICRIKEHLDTIKKHFLLWVWLFFPFNVKKMWVRLSILVVFYICCFSVTTLLETIHFSKIRIYFHNPVN